MKKIMYAVFTVISVALMLTGCDGGEDDTPIKKFNVTFDSRGGSSVASQSIEQGAKVSRPAAPTYGEFIFVDWFKDQACTKLWNFNTDVVEADITLYAKWTSEMFTVTFNTNGGSAIDAQSVAKGATLAKPLPPTKHNAAFENWYKDQALTTLYDFATPVTTNITLYAKWTTITIEALQELLNESYRLQQNNYTSESYNNMDQKRQAAQNVVSSGSTNANEIATAYEELSAAIAALVKNQNRDAVDIYINSVIDNFIYVKAGEVKSIYAEAVDARNEPATDSRVIFQYDNSQMSAFADQIEVQDNYIHLTPKSTLTAGQTISITVKSASNLSISKVVTVKVAGVGEMKKMYIDIVNALPSPDKIAYEHYSAIDRANTIYYAMSGDEMFAPEVAEAKKKLDACEDAYYALPERVKYSFKGNVCTLYSIEGADDVEEVGEFTYAVDKGFPAGSYTPKFWMPAEKGNGYYQMMLVMKSDGTGLTRYRSATDENGAGATAWEDDSVFTYTYTGNQTAGGILFLTFDREDDNNEPGPVPQSAARAKLHRRSF